MSISSHLHVVYWSEESMLHSLGLHGAVVVQLVVAPTSKIDQVRVRERERKKKKREICKGGDWILYHNATTVQYQVE